MPDIRITVSMDQQATVKRVLDGISFRGQDASAVALQAAVSKTIDAGKTLIRREIQRHLRLRIKAIDAVIEPDRGSYKDFGGSITVTRESIPLIEYLTSAQRGNLSNRVATKGLRNRFGTGRLKIRVRKIAQGKYVTSESIKDAFVQVMPGSGKLGIWRRTGEKKIMMKGNYKGKLRDVFVHMAGPTAYGVLMNARNPSGKRVIEDVETQLGDILEKKLDQQIARFAK